MRRRILTATMVGAAALLLTATPASAKGIASAHFTGPGLPPGGITISGDRPPLFSTGLLEQVRDFWTPRRLGISRAELGPSYEVSFTLERFMTRGAPDMHLHQTLYPYAKGGLWSYTPAGQRFGTQGGPIPPGWYSNSDPALLRFLVAHGFPARAPAVAVAAIEPASSSIGTAAVWGAVGFASMLGLLGLNLRRRRRA